MALIKCTECGKEISDKATTCPNCGAPVNAEGASTQESTPNVSSISHASTKPKKEKKKGSCLMTAIKILGIIIILFIVLSFLFGGNNDEESRTVESEDTSTTESSTTEATNEEADEVDNTFIVGDTVETEDCKISFLSAGEYDTGNEYLQPKDGYVFYQAEFEFENTGDSDLALSSMLGWECYADGYMVDQTWIGDENGLDGSISSGKKAKGSVYFEVPADAESVELEYETNFWTEDKVIFILK